MLSTGRKVFIVTLFLTIFLGGASLLLTEKLFPSASPGPVAFVPPGQIAVLPKESLPPPEEQDVRAFVGLYLEAYKNVRAKNNSEDLKNFFSKSALGEIARISPSLEKSITDIDRYEIGEVIKPAFGEGERYIARVRVYKTGEFLSPPTGDAWPISIVKEGGELKIQTWFFQPPH